MPELSLRCPRAGWASTTLAVIASLVRAPAAMAQIDLGGEWEPVDSPDQLHQAQGPFAADFLGIPLNAQGREMGAETSADYQEQLERQCQTWLAQYFIEGPFAIVFKPVEDTLSGTVIGWNMNGTPDRQALTVWIDGRGPPAPQALHTLSGYATGHWEGDTLAVVVTHLQDGLLVRNGAPASDQAVLNMFINREGDLMTIVGIIHDPVYLSAPFVRTRVFLHTDARFQPGWDVNHCTPAEVMAGFSDGYHSAQYLPGKNPQINYMLEHYGIPPDVSLGRADEIYPEFREQLRSKYKYTIPTGYCQQACCTPRGMNRGGILLCPAAEAKPDQ